MAGTINLALSQQFDMDGVPLSGGLLYFFQAATTTPQNAFQDTGLTIPFPNPIVLDASGRVPMFYLADGNIKIRLTNKGGVTVIAADNLLVIGPSSGGGGGGGGVDPNTVIVTGDIKARFGTGTVAGFVRCNGNTVGNAVSGATERAHADCQALFEYLWATNVLGVFSGSTPDRGITATGDFNGNKRIALPDLRGRTIAGMDDMGATAAGRLTSTYFGSSAVQLGNAGGDEKHVLTVAELAAHAHGVNDPTHAHSWGGTFGTGAMNSNQAHSHPISPASLTAGGLGATAGPTGQIGAPGAGATDPTNIDHTHNVSVGGSTSGNATGISIQNNGSGSPHAGVSPAMVLTFYIKL